MTIPVEPPHDLAVMGSSLGQVKLGVHSTSVYIAFKQKITQCNINIIQVYSGITRGRVLDGELLYTEILEVNLFAFAYRLFHNDFSPIYEATIYNIPYTFSLCRVHCCLARSIAGRSVDSHHLHLCPIRLLCIHYGICSEE